MMRIVHQWARRARCTRRPAGKGFSEFQPGFCLRALDLLSSQECMDTCWHSAEVGAWHNKYWMYQQNTSLDPFLNLSTKHDSHVHCLPFIVSPVMCCTAGLMADVAHSWGRAAMRESAIGKWVTCNSIATLPQASVGWQLCRGHKSEGPVLFPRAKAN